ncbi:hypothetical protein [Entomobacter blattae]|uniref:Yip1 domain-containing protein n=1 Tax=Entomobacter blattae TaxID=2762277 RepID=A0A7H1NSM7_9PROT|nr:hypothetical protein [Entomobacter blattae]QNT78787.1 hypothetical protein JGUZn3_15640 [Entomobacter blattae]
MKQYKPRSGKGSSQVTHIARGLWALARGKPNSFQLLGEDKESFLRALAPHIALILVSFFVRLKSDTTLISIKWALFSLCSLLFFPVVIQLLSGVFKRREYWLRFTVAYLWSIWIVGCAFALILLLGSLFVHSSNPLIVKAALIIPVIYSLWLTFFMILNGLKLKMPFGILFFLCLFGINLLGGVAMLFLFHNEFLHYQELLQGLPPINGMTS